MASGEVYGIFAPIQSGPDGTGLRSKERLEISNLLFDVLPIQVIQAGDDGAARSAAARIIHGHLAGPLRVGCVQPALALLFGANQISTNLDRKNGERAWTHDAARRHQT